MFTVADIAKLREMTGAGMMDAKKALTEANGNMEAAVDLLRKSGAAKAAKKAERATAEGRVQTYMHGNGKLAVMVEIMCETDFVARNEDFITFCQDLAMHIAAAAPQYTTREEVPAEVVEREKAIHRDQLAAEGKPAEVVEKILEGKMNKFYEEIVLLDQKFVKDDELTVAQVLEGKVLKIGENLRIGRFVRMALGA
ncbi:translation elongation factor Ts [bacterium]|nr:translation elongation factor Ts [bacterium]NBX48844.1 translation elongation factor Ts [bacterium]